MFFPITNATELDERTNISVTTVVGSPVLAATVGPGLNFSGLVDPVRISLRLNDLGVSVNDFNLCVSFDCLGWSPHIKVCLFVTGLALTHTSSINVECHKRTTSMCLLGF